MASTEIISAADYRAGLVGKASRKAKPTKATVLPLGGQGAVYTLTYQGVGLSSNKWYAGMHWSKRRDLKAEWVRNFHPLIVAANMSGIQAMRLTLRYRSKHDVDNTTAMIKLIVDLLKGWFIPDDTPSHFCGFSVEYDGSLPDNTFIFSIIELI